MNVSLTSIICVSRCKYRNQSHVENHCHNFYHLLYLTGGGGTLFIDGEENKAQENDIYIIHPGVYHEIVSDPVSPLNTLELKFMTEDPNLINGMKQIPVKINNMNKKIKLLLDNLLEEASHKRPLYKEIITTNVIELLLQIMRFHYPCPVPGQTQPPNNQKIIPFDTLLNKPYPNQFVDEILQYIHNNFSSSVTLGQLAKLFTVNQAYLCRIFSRTFGIAPIQYVNNLRIHKAKEMLAYTDFSITEISEQVGFHSIHYLSRYFAQKEKMSPMEYRQKVKDSIYLFVEDKYKIVDFKVEIN